MINFVWRTMKKSEHCYLFFQVSEARWGTLPLFNVSVYMNTIFEPHNAIVHVSQNFLNFL